MADMIFEIKHRFVSASFNFIVLFALLVFLSLGSMVYAAPASVQGNGIIEADEQCDDGNLLNGDGCSSAGRVEENCYDIGNTFSFFSFADSYTSAGSSGLLRILRDAVNQGRYPTRLIPRFWISSGDIPYMSSGNTALDLLNDNISNTSYPFICSASSRKFPFYVAIGNHDIDGYASTTPETQADYWSNYLGPRLPFTLVGIMNFKWGPNNGYDSRTTYSFDYKNAHFAIVNQYYGDLAYPTNAPLGCIRQDQYDWIDQDLSLTTQPIKFIFGHEPAWPYCSVKNNSAQYCPVGSIDNQNPDKRPRPYSTTGDWTSAYGEHWGDSLEDPRCPQGSREAFWSMLARHNVVAHFVGHTHAYGSRLVEGSGARRNDVSCYGKTGQQFNNTDGVWELDEGQAHTSAGASYILTTVKDNVVTFESYDQLGTSELFQLIESWKVHVDTPPTITSPAEGATFEASEDITIVADVPGHRGAFNEVDFYTGNTLAGVALNLPYEITWSDVDVGTYAITAVAVDTWGVSTASKPVHVTIYPDTGNHAPLLTAIQDKAVDEGIALSITASAWDEDSSDVLSYSLVTAPDGAFINSATGEFSWTPNETQGPGKYPVVIRVTDNNTFALTADTRFIVTVNEVNQAPVLEPIENRTVDEGQALSFKVIATDQDLPVNALTFSLIGTSSGATIGTSNGVFSWNPGVANVGQNTFTIRVTDDGIPSAVTDEVLNVTVTNIDHPLTLNPIGNKLVQATAALSFTALATDPDSVLNALTYSLIGAPAGAVIDPTSGQFSWTPAFADIGVYSFTVRVTEDGPPGAMAQETISVTVQSPSDLAMSVVSTATSSVLPGGSFSLSNTVKNSGTLSEGPFTVAFHLSNDAAFGGADDIDLVTTRTVTSLAAGATNPVTTTLVVPVATPLGSYYVCALADSGNTLVESDQNNNSLCTPAPLLVTRPDLVLNALEPGAAAAVASGTLQVTDTTKNQGLIGSFGVRINYRLSRNTVYGDSDDVALSQNRVTRALSAGAIDSGGITLTVPSTITAGTYYVCAQADGDSKVLETDETNNSRCSTGQVIIPLADLMLSALSTPATSVATGAVLTLSETITNTGGTKVGSRFVIKFHLSKDAVYGGADDVAFSNNIAVTSLAAGASSTATSSLTVPATISRGFYYLVAMADADGLIAEGNESNNTLAIAAPIWIGPPTLSVMITAPSSGSVFTDPPGITVTAQAVGVLGLVNEIRFFANGILVGTDTTSPYSVTWTGIAPGSYMLSAVAVENDMTSTSSIVNLTILHVNQAPVLNFIGNCSVYEGQLLTFTATAMDADGDTLTYSLTGAPEGATIGAANGVFAWTPGSTEAGRSHAFTVKVTDSGIPNAMAEETITVTVNKINAAPILSLIGNRAIDEGQLLTFTATATDADGDTLTYSLIGAPEGATIGAANGVFTWTPGASDAGSHALTVKVTDSGIPNASTEEAVMVTVNNVNSAPVLNPIGNRSVEEGQPLTFTATAMDADGDTLTYSLTGAPEGATIGAVNGVFTWTPGSTEVGSYAFTVKVTDSGIPNTSAEEVVTVTVNNVNNAPVLNPIGNRSVDEGQLLTFTVTATDANGDTLTYSLLGAAAGATIGAANGVFAWTPGSTEVGSHAFTVKVTDSGISNATAEETVTVTVNNVNIAPVLNPIGNRSVDEGQPLTFKATATDADGDTLTYSLTGAPEGATIGAANGVFTWTPGASDAGSSPAFTIKVTDSGIPNATVEETVTITVNNVNNAPVLTFIGNKAVGEGQPLTFTATATDPDIPANALTYGLVGAPMGASIDAISGIFAWTPGSSDVGIHTIVVRVTDNGVPNASDQETITVTVKSLPDLIMSAVNNPALSAMLPGSSLSLSNTVKNSGSVAVPSSFAVAFNLSSNAVFGGTDDINLNTTRTVTSIGVDRTNAASTTLTIPSSTPLGNYYICALSDSGNNITEQNEENNGLCTPSTIAISRPDLVVTAVEPGASVAVASGSLQVDDTMMNQGLISTLTQMRVSYRFSRNTTFGDADDVAVSSTRSIAGLSAGALNSGTLTMTVPGTIGAGAYYICAQGDSENKVAEADETNNTRCSTGQVSVLPPDLTVNSLSTASTVVIQGASFPVSDSITNTGGTTVANRFVVKYHLSNDTIYGGADDVAFSTSRAVYSLAPNANSTASTTLTVPTSTPKGNYYIVAMVDADGAIAEVSEANNTRFTEATIEVK